jgi:hypothetical protein
MAEPALVVVLLASVACLGGAAAVFVLVELPRPGLGVVDVVDVLLLIAVVVVAPIADAAVPSALTSTLLGLVLLAGIAFALEPVCARRWRWAICAALLAAELMAHGAGSTTTQVAVNDLVVAVAAIAIANVWAQGGLRARDTAVLACALALYDLLATLLHDTTGTALGRLAGAPFAPVLAWPRGGGGWFGVGLADLLLIALVPIVLLRAYDRSAALVGAALATGGLAAALVVGAARPPGPLVPVMAAVGPLFCVVYLTCRRRWPVELTMFDYRFAQRTRRRRAT